MPHFNVTLATIPIQLLTPDDVIASGWHFIFGSHFCEPTAVSPLRVSFSIDQTLPHKPATFDFEDKAVGFGLTHQNDKIIFCFQAGAWVEVDLEKKAINGRLTLQSLPHLEDMTTIALAPLLRRQGIFLLHAFGIARQQEAVLFVGPTGSGKTTAGLALVLNGWQLLGNDLIMLTQTAAGIVANPTPGTIRIRPQTAALLNSLHEEPLPTTPISTQQFVSRWGLLQGEKQLVSAVYFPHIHPDQSTRRTPLARSIGLVKLLEASVDRWDTAMLKNHMGLLQQLVHQAHMFELINGRSIHSLPDQL